MTLVSRFVFFQRKNTPEGKTSNRITTMEISIVIPVRDNQKGVDSYLDEFFLTHPLEDFPKEIIIVDNNSSPPIILKDRHLSSLLPIKLLICQKEGPAAARNFGVLNATGEWILFNDSDCLPTDNLLSGYLKSDNGSVAYAGNIKSLAEDRLSSYYQSQEILLPLKTKNHAGEYVPQYLITANSLVWKTTFMEIGGFNEQIKIAGGEDIDLGLRLSQYGNLSYAFDSIVLHDFNDGLIGFYKRFRRYGKGNRLLEDLWQINMRPRPFMPNEKTVSNIVMALLQYLFLLGGYVAANREIKRDLKRELKFNKTHKIQKMKNIKEHNQDDDNRKDQLNPNNDKYWQSRGHNERPDDWRERADGKGNDKEKNETPKKP